MHIFNSPPPSPSPQILQYIVIPMFSATFDEGTKTDELLGGAPDPEHDSDENIISVFINKVINPEKPFASSVSAHQHTLAGSIPPSIPPSLPPSLSPFVQDSVCILLLQFSSLLVENAYAHIHDSNNKKQGAKLRRLMTFAWPCLLPKQCVVSCLKLHQNTSHHPLSSSLPPSLPPHSSRTQLLSTMVTYF